MVATSLITLIGVIPGAVLFFAALYKYDGYFNDQKVSFSFLMGLIGGGVFGVLHGMLDGSMLGNIATTIVVFVLMFSFAQVMYLVVVVNRKGLRQKHDAVFSGMSLGMGSGSIMVVYTIYLFARVIEDSGLSLGVSDYLVYIGLASSSVLIFGAAGIFAGLFAYKQRREHIIIGTALFAFYYAAIVPFRIGGLGAVFMGISFLAALGVSIAAFLFAYKNIESNLPSELEKEQRREARKRSRED